MRGPLVDLVGQIAVVTGAASGIGRATALATAGAGARVIAADINQAGLDETVSTIAESGGTAVAVRTDVTDPQSVGKLRAATQEQFGVASVLVNCVGWDIIEPFLQNSREYWDRVIDLNYRGPLTVAREFVESMIDHEVAGRIINIASDAGRVGSSGEAVYAGAKGGVIAFSKSLAREVARYGITVNCVCPGPTDTPLFRSQPEKMQQALIRAIPMRRLGQPEDVARAVVYFASPGAAYVTGQVLSVSGGLTMAG